MGGFTPRGGAGATAGEVWGYAARLLTNLSNIRAAYIDLIPGIPTTPELEAAALVRYNALVAAIGGIPTTPELEADAFTRYANLAVALALIPTTPELEVDALARAATILAAIGGIPTTPELEASAATRYGSLFVMDRGRVKVVDVGDIADWHLVFLDIGGAVIPAADITAGSCVIEQWRGIVKVDDKTPTSHAAANGEIQTVYTFTVAEGWVAGDTAHVVLSGAAVEVGGVTTSIPEIMFHTHIGRESAIQTMLGASEFETEWNTNPLVDNVTSLALETLSTHTILAADFEYPTGATERRVILLAMISAQAQGDATHHIGVVVRRSINDGAWADLLNLTANPPLGLSAEASMGNLVLPYDISALVEDGDKLEFRFQVDSDDAGSVNYTTSFIVVLVYRMAA